MELRAEWDDLLDESRQRVYFSAARLEPALVDLLTLHAEAASTSSPAATKTAGWSALPPFIGASGVCAGSRVCASCCFSGWGLSSRRASTLDVVARKGYEKAVGLAVAQHLKDSRDWDRVSLSQVPATSTALPQVVRALRDSGERATMAAYEARAPYIDTSGSWEGFKQSLGRSMRRNVEYYGRRLFKNYDCEFARVDSLEQLDRTLDALVQLHQARWTAKGQPGSFSDTSFAPFLRQAVSQALLDGRLRFWTLKINGRIEAALVGFLDNGVVHYFQKGFNPQFAKDDLGTAMLGLAVRDCFDDDKVHAFDFMGGGAPYKDLWARASQQTMSCEVHRINIRTRLLGVHGSSGPRDPSRGPCPDSSSLAAGATRMAPQLSRASRARGTAQVLLLAWHQIADVESVFRPLLGAL